MNYAEMLDKAHALLTEAQGIVSNPNSTAEDFEKVERLEAEAADLRTKAGRLMEITDAADSLREAKEKGQAEPTPAGQFKTFGEQLRAVKAVTMGYRDPRLKFFHEPGDPDESKDLTGAVGASGGVLIEQQFINRLYSVMVESSLVRGRATVIPMASRSVLIPALKQSASTANEPNWFGGMSAFWTEEGGEKTTTEPAFRQIELVARKLAAFTRSSDELLSDSAQSLEAFLTGPMGFPGIVNWKLDYAYFRGTGAGMPLGVLNSPALVSVPRTADGTPVQYVDLVAMLERALPSAKLEWYISQSVMSNLMTMQDPASNYMWPTLFQGGASVGKPATLLGYPVNFTEKLPFVGTAGDVLLADFSYYLIGDRQAVTIQSTNAEKFLQDQTTWRVVYRGDGQPWLDSPITLADGTTTISPFVALGAKTT